MVPPPTCIMPRPPLLKFKPRDHVASPPPPKAWDRQLTTETRCAVTGLGEPVTVPVSYDMALDDARECQYRRRWLADYATQKRT